MGVFEDKEFRKIFEPKREEVNRKLEKMTYKRAL
jgi:hypothetical protein